MWKYTNTKTNTQIHNYTRQSVPASLGRSFYILGQEYLYLISYFPKVLSAKEWDHFLLDCSGEESSTKTFSCSAALLTAEANTLKMAGKQGPSLRASSRTSSSTKHYIGTPQSHFPPGKLPSLQDVLKVQAFLRQQPGCHNRSIDKLCCPTMSYNSRESNCDKEGGCVSRGKPCLLSTTKLPYLQAGIAIISDWSWVQKLKGANSEYQKMLKIFGRLLPR